MGETLSAQGLMEYVEAHLRKKDRPRTEGQGKEPHYPMAVVFIGNKSMDAFDDIASALTRFWPQYETNLLYLGVRCSDHGTECCSISRERGAQTLTVDELNMAVNNLFSDKMYFENRQRLLVYYIFNTNQCLSPSDYNFWMKELQKFKDNLHTGTLDISDLLISLLDENFARDSISKQIRNQIREHMGTSRLCSAECLISNRCQDNTTYEDWRNGYRIAADLIALSNNSDSPVSSRIFGGGIMTVSYVCEEKPYAEISNVVVRQLLNVLDPISKQSVHGERGRTRAELLGMSDEGTLELLDQYVDQFLQAKLPTPEQIELFPRREESNWELAQLHADEFNEETLGAWDCYLQLLVRRTKEEIEANGSLRDRWQEDYSARLRRNFTCQELILLGEEIEEVKALLRVKRAPSRGKSPIADGIDQLKYLLSSDENLLSLFEKVIMQQAQEAEELEAAWQTLLDSRVRLHSVRDQKLVSLYTQAVNDYRDNHIDEMREAFRGVRTKSDLDEMLKDLLNDILLRVPVFAANLEQELQERLKLEKTPGDAKQYISALLTGSNMPVFFRSNFSLGIATVSAILIKKGTPLFYTISENPDLPQGTYYYDIDYSNAVESIQIYSVSEQNLISDGEGEQK